MPYTPNGATHLGVDVEHWRDVSFVGRPAPRLHYPAGPKATVSAGETSYDAEAQLLRWSAPGDAGSITLRLERRA